MANEISLVTASGRTVTPKDDGIIYEVFSPGNGIIYGGAVTIKDSSTLHITAGHGIVCGRMFTIDDSDIPVSLSGSGSLLGRLYIHLDLADAADPITLLVETGASLTPEVHDQDVNINNGVYDINIATFDVDTVTISNLVDVAPKVVGGGSSADKIGYDNTQSGMTAENVQDAIDELSSDMDIDLSDTSLPSSTTFNALIQMMAEKLYPDKWNAVADQSLLVSVARSVNHTAPAIIDNGGSFTITAPSSAQCNGIVWVNVPRDANITVNCSGSISGFQSGCFGAFLKGPSTATGRDEDCTILQAVANGSFSYNFSVSAGSYFGVYFATNANISYSITFTVLKQQ